MGRGVLAQLVEMYREFGGWMVHKKCHWTLWGESLETNSEGVGCLL